jgi:Tfp pilus assembly protein PilN
MRAINLLPKDAVRARRTAPDPALLTGVVGAGVVIVALGWMFMGATKTVQSKQAERDDLAAQLATLNRYNPPPKVLPIQAAVAPLQAPRVSAATDALGERVPWDFVLGQIARALPSGVKLTTLDATSPLSPNPTLAGTASTATSSGAPSSNLNLAGWTYAQESVALFMSRLQRLSSLIGNSVTLDRSTKNAGTVGRPVYQFSNSAQIRPPGASS